MSRLRADRVDSVGELSRLTEKRAEIPICCCLCRRKIGVSELMDADRSVLIPEAVLCVFICTENKIYVLFNVLIEVDR